MNPSVYTFAIAAATATGVVVRPFRLPEALWAVAGAASILGLGILNPGQVWTGVTKGTDVYLFLIGMMLLSELARKEGLFDWVAAIATSYAKGSPKRLFLLIYVVGAIVTALLSNDATAVVLTPAVYAACRAAKVNNPLPYLLICAFIANAASFVLPIANPANLVIFAGGEMPSLERWMTTFLAPSIGAIVTTFVALYLTQRKTLACETLAIDVPRPDLSLPARVAGAGLVITAIILLVASAAHLDLGMPTFIAGTITTLIVLSVVRQNPLHIIREISWSVIPLVAGLFVVVEAINQTGATALLAQELRSLSAHSEARAIAFAGVGVAFLSNVVNNLPAGLFAGSAVGLAQVSDRVAGAVLIGVDLGPNLSVTGSLATILWLAALRREGIHVSALSFLKIGIVVMVPSLIVALALL
jgi:arsenical pump membrane protein